MRRRLHVERLGGDDDEIAWPDPIRCRRGINRHCAIPAGAFATQALGGHRLGMIGPQRDGMDLMTGVNHQRCIDRSHRATTDNRNLRHVTLRARSLMVPMIFENAALARRGNQDTVAAGAACRFANIALEPNLAAGDQPQRIGIDAVLDLEECARPASPAVSSSLTATAPCITIGPASVSGMTKCTVAPEIFTPARSA